MRYLSACGLAMAAVLSLAACGGGGNSGSQPTLGLDDIRELTDLSAPAETAAAQEARQQDIVSRADSMILSTMHVEQVFPDETRAFPRLSECSGGECEVLDPVTGETITAYGLTSGLRRPAGPASLSRFRLLSLPRLGASAAACLLALGLVLAFGATPAQAEVKFVGNSGQGDIGSYRIVFDFGQQFTTGSDARGYRLTRADVLMVGGTGTPPGFSVSIRSNNASNLPGASLGTLTQQGDFPSPAGRVRFEASGTGIELDANTDYWLVLDVTSMPDADHQYRIYNRLGDAEDPGAAAGWSIANNSQNRNRTGTGGDWRSDNRSLRIAIYGNVRTNLEVSGRVLRRRRTARRRRGACWPGRTRMTRRDRRRRSGAMRRCWRLCRRRRRRRSRSC